MAIKFNTLSFEIKDIVLIIGGVAAFFRLENNQEKRFNEFELKIQAIVSQVDINEVKVNARFDAIDKKTTDNKDTSAQFIQKFAVCPDIDLKIKKKRLVKFSLV